VAAAT
jgi:Bacterial inner membrane protein